MHFFNDHVSFYSGMGNIIVLPINFLFIICAILHQATWLMSLIFSAFLCILQNIGNILSLQSSCKFWDQQLCLDPLQCKMWAKMISAKSAQWFHQPKWWGENLDLYSSPFRRMRRMNYIKNMEDTKVIRKSRCCGISTAERVSSKGI